LSPQKNFSTYRQRRQRNTRHVFGFAQNRGNILWRCFPAAEEAEKAEKVA